MRIVPNALVLLQREVNNGCGVEVEMVDMRSALWLCLTKITTLNSLLMRPWEDLVLVEPINALETVQKSKIQLRAASGKKS